MCYKLCCISLCYSNLNHMGNCAVLSFGVLHSQEYCTVMYCAMQTCNIFCCTVMKFTVFCVVIAIMSCFN